MSDLPFTLDQLRILKAIAAEGSFKRAADSLYVSQPAVSLQVQNLERSLAVPLFDRGGRRHVRKILRRNLGHHNRWIFERRLFVTSPVVRPLSPA